MRLRISGQPGVNGRGCWALTTWPPRSAATPAAGWARRGVNGRGRWALTTWPPRSAATPAAGWARRGVNGRGRWALTTWPPRSAATPAGGARWEAPGWRRSLQPALAALWPFDAVLQYQTFMF